MSAPNVPIAHDPQQRRFTLEVDGHRAELDYVLEQGRMVITHTGVPAPIGGRGLAAQLVTAALEHAQAQGWKVVPACSYAAVFVQRHPQYAALLA
ncbi:acetyltransferase [Xanthomonas sp. NCPPB 1128]|uniref:GNAT family N-acetyltransferase n=1 Tax=Xanthomonas sp. NCPPB 1128 TaxID=1775876 RepID=UPI00065AC072|nr:GNAT family N-acetyltransferase [Xanthomonas sp. NCPPB 1128]KMM73986.1 acetyltransferase [Xanthomonas sp. NCPPB 1128]